MAADSALEKQTAGIRIAGVSHSYRERGGDPRPVLQRIDLDIEPGEFVSLLGPSGCGKTTLLNIIGGFVRPTEGEVVAGKKRVEEPGADRAVVFQSYALLPWYTAVENVELGLRFQGADRNSRRAAALDCLEMVHLHHAAGKYPHELSGGMKQRIAIARAIATKAPILLMDEPFGALDALTRSSLQDELLRITREAKRTVVFVTHSVDESVLLSDRICVMGANPGRLESIVKVERGGIDRLGREAPEFFEQVAHLLPMIKASVEGGVDE
ncbi:ABC transporter ATP-binding protein [Amycolatopsis jejuensis]|uniref:ABC transporter ATP-binding protein n=1 Tax=Amycolatopsis jejuensis TaxID=330084 RepID=UPI000526CB9F|nr:ABC transporter ATP-binding protein [Amycolatopsis jejuensis]